MDEPVMAMGKRASEVRWQAGGDSRQVGDNRGGVCYSRPRSLCFHSKSLTQVLS